MEFVSRVRALSIWLERTLRRRLVEQHVMLVKGLLSGVLPRFDAEFQAWSQTNGLGGSRARVYMALIVGVGGDIVFLGILMLIVFKWVTSPTLIGGVIAVVACGVAMTAILVEGVLLEKESGTRKRHPSGGLARLDARVGLAMKEGLLALPAWFHIFSLLAFGLFIAFLATVLMGLPWDMSFSLAMASGVPLIIALTGLFWATSRSLRKRIVSDLEGSEDI